MKTQNPVVWFEIYVEDIMRAQKFYESVLKVRMTEAPAPPDQPMKMMFFPSDMESKNRASGSLVEMKEIKAGGNSTLVYFYSEDCSAEQGRIEAAGGKVHTPKTSLGEYGFMVLGVDTEGNRFGVHSMK